MYSEIYCPVTKNYINIKSKNGLNLLNKYIKQVGGSNSEKTKKIRKCGICRVPGHTRRNCPQLGVETKMQDITKVKTVKTVVNSKTARKTGPKSFHAAKSAIDTTNMLQINVDKLGPIYIEVTEYIGGGQFAEVYAVNIYNNSEKMLSDQDGNSTVCIKVSGLKSTDLENDFRETKIAMELSQISISPQIHDYYITNDYSIKRNLVKLISSSTPTRKLQKLSTAINKDTNYLRLMIMQKLNGYALGDTTRYGNSKKLTAEHRKIICEKITAMHKKGYIHNDLHQDNIFIDVDHGPYIIDFGFSQKIEENDGSGENFMNFIKKSDYSERMYTGIKSKTLKNYIDIDGDTLEDAITKKPQFCKKASWDCERAWQAEIIHKDCSSNWDKNMPNYSKAKDLIKNRTNSGYVK